MVRGKGRERDNNMKYKIKESIVIRKINDDTVLYDSENSCFYGLVGALAQYFVDHQEFEKSALTDFLLEEYEVDSITAERDVNNIVDELMRNGILYEVN